MIRRGKRTPFSLSKSLSRITLLDGSKDYSEACFGYEQDGSALKVCSAPGGQTVNGVTAKNLYAVSQHVNFGLTLLLYTNGFAVVFTDGGTPYNFAQLGSGKPFSAEARNENGEGLIVYVCGNRMCVYNGETENSETYNLPIPMYGGVMHCGRLFAVDSNNGCKVVWSGLRVTDWEDGVQGSGYALLDSDLGRVLELKNFGDDILCVRERGFSVMHAMADSRNFRIAPSQNVIRTGGKIDVGGVIGSKYYFTSGDGLYCFDGDSIALEYATDANLSSIGRAYVYGDGYVYADCVYCGVNCIMRYDPESKKAVFFGGDCSFPFIADGKLYCSKSYGFYRLSTENGEDGRIWRSKPIGSCGRKVLKNIWVDASGSPEITVICGDISRKFNGTGKIAVNASGELIKIEIRGHTEIKSVVAELEVRK
ncbi:MAG: hypothetical protein ACI4MB_04140 [Candidatus Coproplasma sp.]